MNTKHWVCCCSCGQPLYPCDCLLEYNHYGADEYCECEFENRAESLFEDPYDDYDDEDYR